MKVKLLFWLYISSGFMLCNLSYSQSAMDFCTLVEPTSITIDIGSPVTVYAQAFEPGITPGAGMGEGVEAWIGIGYENTDPATWIYYSWTEAEYNDVPTGDNDEVKLTLNYLPTGTYYYATRWRLDNGEFVYGGSQGEWNGTTSINGIITVECNMPVPIVTDTHQVFCEYAEVGDLAVETTSEGWGIVFRDEGGSMLVSYSTLMDGATYYVSQVLSDCESDMVAITVQVVDDSSLDVASPQYFEPGSLISIYNDVEVNAIGTISWYDNVMDAGNGENMLPQDAMVGQGIYFVTQTIAGCVSNAVPVVLADVLGNEGFNAGTFSYYPNPVQDALNLSCEDVITDITVYNLLGQIVLQSSPRSKDAGLVMSKLAAGAYMVKVSTGSASQDIKVIKK